MGSRSERTLQTHPRAWIGSALSAFAKSKMMPYKVDGNLEQMFADTDPGAVWLAIRAIYQSSIPTDSE